MKRIYLDNNATTPLDPRVFRAMYPCHLEPLNPSSVHHFGQTARKLIQEARRKVSSYLGVKPPEIIFTSGGTEAINFCIRGLASENGHLITSNIEHSCIYETALFLQNRGISVTFLGSDETGTISPHSVKSAITPKTKAIILSAVNGETGVKNDIDAYSQIALEHGIHLVIDGVALMGKEPFTIPEGVSAMCFSGHKFHGPKGTGFLYIRPRFQLPPLLTGGDQEYQRRAGTENLEGILGLAEAVWLLEAELPEKTYQMKDLRDRFEMSLMREFETIQINGCQDRTVNVSNLAFNGVDGETLLIALDQQGIAASHGSACSSGALEPSRVLQNMGLSSKRASSSLRFSLSRFTTREDVDEAVHVISSLLKQLKNPSRND